MKIVFLVSHLLGGGAERTVSYLSNYIAKNKQDDVTILSLSGESFYQLCDKVNCVNLNISSTNKNLFDRVYKICLRFIKVRKAIKALQPDVVVCMLANTAKYLPKNKKYKLVCSERSNPLIITDKKDVERRNKILRLSDGIIFQTERAKLCFPIDIQNKGVVIPNAVGNPFVNKVVPTTCKEKSITAMGRLHKAKDYPTLIKAFKIVGEKHPEFTLQIYGGGNKTELENLAKELNVFDKVKFMGAKEDAILDISKSTCYVLSSIYEGMPNALMEAMAVGLPCVSTDCPFGPSELIVDGENGLLVPVGDETKLAAAITKIIEDSNLSKKLSDNARNILNTNNIEVISEKYYQFIKGQNGN